ncbi:juvenile hormone acid O-methyltransferase-like [Camponotus floridanus]|uniref:juvenile hormone acid O-methyltransferase-like n=1 Tax=Camponotus floridanus TaxID=104421 RepID=UPI000DC6C2B7|nr:juvenile hormone acid O-methyltransferase-like [Camponotus floridanus]
MKVNPEETLKEKNVSLYTDAWDLKYEGLVPPGKCMEINCSFGYTTRHFLLPKLHRKSTIIGTDSSESMIEYARKNYDNTDRIDFEVLDIQTKGVLPEKYIAEFDHIFSFPTVHSRNDILQEFQNVYKMLKPGGIFHLSMIVSHDAFKIYDYMKDYPFYGSYFEKYTSPFQHACGADTDVCQLLLNADFFIKYCDLDSVEYESNYLLPYIFCGLPFINEMSPGQQKYMENIFTNQLNVMKGSVYQSNLNTCTDKYDIVSIHAIKPRIKPVTKTVIKIYN